MDWNLYYEMQTDRFGAYRLYTKSALGSGGDTLLSDEYADFIKNRITGEDRDINPIFDEDANPYTITVWELGTAEDYKAIEQAYDRTKTIDKILADL